MALVEKEKLIDALKDIAMGDDAGRWMTVRDAAKKAIKGLQDFPEAEVCQQGTGRSEQKEGNNHDGSSGKRHEAGKSKEADGN